MLQIDRLCINIAKLIDLSPTLVLLTTAFVTLFAAFASHYVNDFSRTVIRDAHPGFWLRSRLIRLSIGIAGIAVAILTCLVAYALETHAHTRSIRGANGIGLAGLAVFALICSWHLIWKEIIDVIRNTGT